MISFKTIIVHATIELLSAVFDYATGFHDSDSSVKILYAPTGGNYKPVSQLEAESKKASKSGALDFALSDLILVLQAVDGFPGFNKLIKAACGPAGLVRIIKSVEGTDRVVQLLADIGGAGGQVPLLKSVEGAYGLLPIRSSTRSADGISKIMHTIGESIGLVQTI